MGFEITFRHGGCRFCLMVRGVSSQNTSQPTIGGGFKHIWVDFHFSDISLILE